MKNLFTSVAFLLAAFSMQAKEYSGNLNIFVADMGNLNINQNTTITVNQQTDGKYELIIKNFYFLLYQRPCASPRLQDRKSVV